MKKQAQNANPLEAIKNWYMSLDEDKRKALTRGLIGAAVGGGATGLISALTPKDPEHKRPVLSNALLGAMLGGSAAAAVPYGISLLKARAANDNYKVPLGARLSDSIVRPVLGNLGLAAGAGIGGRVLYKGQEPIRAAWGQASR